MRPFISFVVPCATYTYNNFFLSNFHSPLARKRKQLPYIYDDTHQIDRRSSLVRGGRYHSLYMARYSTQGLAESWKPIGHFRCHRLTHSTLFGRICSVPGVFCVSIRQFATIYSLSVYLPTIRLMATTTSTQKTRTIYLSTSATSEKQSSIPFMLVVKPENAHPFALPLRRPIHTQNQALGRGRKYV